MQSDKTIGKETFLLKSGVQIQKGVELSLFADDKTVYLERKSWRTVGKATSKNKRIL